MILQLNPPIPLDTPQGSARAFFYTDDGQDHYPQFGCFITKSGEFWVFQSRDVKLEKNVTMKVRCDE